MGAQSSPHTANHLGAMGGQDLELGEGSA